MKINNARAVVTGGASGLGHAVAQHIAAMGGKVAILDWQEEAGRTAAQAIGASSSQVRRHFRRPGQRGDGAGAQRAWMASISW